MLLPSAIPCDSNYITPSRTRYQASLFASPPLSPPSSSSSSQSISSSIYSSCRALQSMLTPPQLPSPPTRHSSPPFKLRLRQRKPVDEPSSTTTTPNTIAPSQQPRRRITKRANVAAPRGVNKRRRAPDDEMMRENQYLSEDVDVESDVEDLLVVPSSSFTRPSTPKRARIAPENIPLGLERSDFHTLHLQQLPSQSQSLEGEEVFESVEGDGHAEKDNEWSTEEDRILVELVLEKLKLSKSEWQDCARSLGKDRGSVGRRWKSLMAGGEVGLKRQQHQQRRARIHGTWR